MLSWTVAPETADKKLDGSCCSVAEQAERRVCTELCGASAIGPDRTDRLQPREVPGVACGLGRRLDSFYCPGKIGV